MGLVRTGEKNMKLSNKQIECYNHLKKHKTFLHYMGYLGRFRPNAYYFSNNALKRFRELTVNKLIELKYLEVFDDKGFGDYKVRVNEKISRPDKDL
jgi:hypothetical protein